MLLLATNAYAVDILYTVDKHSYLKVMS